MERISRSTIALTHLQGFRWPSLLSLISLDQNKNVVYPDREDKEGDDLKDDEVAHDAGIAEDSDGGSDGEQDDQHASNAKGELALDLRAKYHRLERHHGTRFSAHCLLCK